MPRLRTLAKKEEDVPLANRGRGDSFPSVRTMHCAELTLVHCVVGGFEKYLEFVLDSYLGRFQSDSDFGQFQRFARSVAFQNTIDRPRLETRLEPLSKTNGIFNGLGTRVTDSLSTAKSEPRAGAESRCEFRWFLRVVETSLEARTIVSVLKSHGPCESFELSKVRIGLEAAEIRGRREGLVVGGKERNASRRLVEVTCDR